MLGIRFVGMIVAVIVGMIVRMIVAVIVRMIVRVCGGVVQFREMLFGGILRKLESGFEADTVSKGDGAAIVILGGDPHFAVGLMSQFDACVSQRR